MGCKFTLTKPLRRFDRWLNEKGYDRVSDIYPGAVHAAALVDDFLDEYPDYNEYQEAIEQHADVVGFVSDYVMDDESEESD